MKQIFILGRNPGLSKEEIRAYFEARNIGYSEIFFDENFYAIESLQEVDIQELGGTIKSGEIIFEGTKKNFLEFAGKNEIIPSDKFSFLIFGNGDVEILKEKFKSERKKAMQKHGRKKIRFQEGEETNLGNADYNLFYHEFNGVIYFGLLNKDYDYSEVKKRDMAKPVRREELAISPRLAKILINLSGAKPGELLLDPFCGIGGILIEAMIKNINVYGIDKDREAVEGAKKNVGWIVNNYQIKSRYTVINSNSINCPDLQFDGIATETPLGKLLRKKPSDGEAKEIIWNFEKLIIPILKHIKKVKKQRAKISITFPVVKNFRVNVEKVCRETELGVVMKPILESRPDQLVSREIIVMK